MRKVGDGTVVAGGFGDHRARADGCYKLMKRLDTGVIEIFRLKWGQHIAGIFEKLRVSILQA